MPALVESSLSSQIRVASSVFAPVDETQYERFKERYWNDRAGFVRDCIRWRDGEGPAQYQLNILDSLATHTRVAVRGPHGLGKTALSAWVILHYALTRDGRDWKVPTTASAWRQLIRFLWPEIRKWTRRLDWQQIGRPPFGRLEQLGLSLKLGTGEAFAVASDTPELIEGAHADHLLYMFDESKAIPGATFDAAEGAFANAGGDTTSEALAFAVSTPGEPQGRFYDIHARKPGYEDWFVWHVTLEDTIAAGRVSREWAEQRKRQWGVDSAVYQNRVLGEFASSEEDGVIPLGWIERANERWHLWKEQSGRGALTTIGVDVAYSGEDKTVFALRYGDAIDTLRSHSKEDTMQTAGRVVGILQANPGAKPIVDVIGYGAGVVDRLRELKYPVVPFNASERSDLTDRSRELGFTNKRSAGWWNLRELLDPANEEEIALPPDDTLTGDLTAPHWQVMSGGKIQVEPKPKIKERIGRSTDAGDAVVMAFWPGNTIDAQWAILTDGLRVCPQCGAKRMVEQASGQWRCNGCGYTEHG